MKKTSIVPIERIERVIYFIRGRKVILDRDLAKLYGAETRALMQSVKRNLKRFPKDFMFQLAWEEVGSLRSQFVILDEKQIFGRGKYTKYQPYVFTEYGAVMAANVLKSERAIAMSIAVVRAFVRLNQVLAGQKEVSKEVTELKSFVLRHAQKSDQEFRKVWRAIEKLAKPLPKELPRIGFRLD